MNDDQEKHIIKQDMTEGVRNKNRFQSGSEIYFSKREQLGNRQDKAMVINPEKLIVDRIKNIITAIHEKPLSVKIESHHKQNSKQSVHACNLPGKFILDGKSHVGKRLLQELK